MVETARKFWWTSIAALAALALLAPDASAQQVDTLAAEGGAAVWTLYRSAVMEDSARIHVATFDSRERAGLPGPSFNAGNCGDVAELLQDRVQVGNVRYWCEKGRKDGSE